MLTKDAILAAPRLPVEEVHVPEWKDEGGDDVVLVRGMTGAERDQWEASLSVVRDGKEIPDPANATAKALVKCIVHPDGSRVFDDRDANELGGQPAAALLRVWRVARRLSGIDERAVEEKARDFPGPSGSGSSMTSPNGSAALSPVS
jgi:hypothetical protein